MEDVYVIIPEEGDYHDPKAIHKGFRTREIAESQMKAMVVHKMRKAMKSDPGGRFYWWELVDYVEYEDFMWLADVAKEIFGDIVDYEHYYWRFSKVPTDQQFWRFYKHPLGFRHDFFTIHSIEIV